MSESSRSSDTEDFPYGKPGPRAMRGGFRLSDLLHPQRLMQRGKISYTQLPSTEDIAKLLTSKQTWQAPPGRRRCGIGKISTTKSIILAIVTLVLLAVFGRQGHQQIQQWRESRPSQPAFHWQNYHRLNGYYYGIKALVPYSQWQPENGYNQSIPISQQENVQLPINAAGPPVDPVKFDPYPVDSTRQKCYLHPSDEGEVPDVYAYPGIPQYMTEPFYGDYKTLGLDDGMCFERFGRYAAYGYGYNETMGGWGPGIFTEQAGAEKIYEKTGFVDYSNVDWGTAQQRCFEKNAGRFSGAHPITGKKQVSRQAYILRTWTGFDYQPHHIYAIRAMITELNLKSGGEYDVHFLVHVKDDSIPIWADPDVYRRVLEENVPREFWNMATLWSEQQMVMYYPDPFPGNFANMAGSKLHGVYRSAHLPLQWFAQEHPEYDHYWNWEMDIRFTGHYYDYYEKLGQWGRKQPRKGIWERSKRFYIPAYHGSWDNFTKFVEQEIETKDKVENNEEVSGPSPVWGPVKDFPNAGMLESPDETYPPTSYEEDNYEWGVGEDADLLTFNPIFDPATTNWVFSWDISGYNTDMPPPPRRAAIITVARLSKRLLDLMHKEVYAAKHTMFPEMWPPTVAFHHGLKAAYVPHPVFFDRDWDLGYMNQVYNYPENMWDSPFGWGEHNMLGSSFYYNSGFSGALWRRWLGMSENNEGGRVWEEVGSGRMCLRPIVHHPIKHENGPVD